MPSRRKRKKRTNPPKRFGNRTGAGSQAEGAMPDVWIPSQEEIERRMAEKGYNRGAAVMSLQAERERTENPT